jgi:hypothetical protein
MFLIRTSVPEGAMVVFSTGRYLDEIDFDGQDAKFHRRVAVTVRTASICFWSFRSEPCRGLPRSKKGWRAEAGAPFAAARAIKNITRRVHVFPIRAGQPVVTQATASTACLPPRAVASGDSEQEYPLPRGHTEA